MKPEGVAKYKHVCLSKSDYDYIINLAGGTPASYVSAFGKVTPSSRAIFPWWSR